VTPRAAPLRRLAAVGALALAVWMSDRVAPAAATPRRVAPVPDAAAFAWQHRDVQPVIVEASRPGQALGHLDREP
jgi:hypothetical protein